MKGMAIHFGVWGGEVGGDNLRRVLATAARCGYSHVVIPLRRPETLDVGAIARAFEQSGIQPLNTTGLAPDSDISSMEREIRHRGIERLKHGIRLARDMGSDQINGVLYGVIAKAERPRSPAEFRASAEALAEVAEYGAELGVRLAIEIVNRYESSLLNTVDQALDYLSIAGHPNIGIHLDTFHMSIEEADTGAAIARALPFLFYFELCQSHRGCLSEGSLNLDRYLKEVAELGYRGLVGVEAFTRQNLSEDHADLLAIWRNTFHDADKLALGAMSLIQKAIG